MARKNRSREENERRAKIRELLKLNDISSMGDIQNLFQETMAVATSRGRLCGLIFGYDGHYEKVD